MDSSVLNVVVRLLPFISQRLSKRINSGPLVLRFPPVNSEQLIVLAFATLSFPVCHLDHIWKPLSGAVDTYLSHSTMHKAVHYSLYASHMRDYRRLLDFWTFVPKLKWYTALPGATRLHGLQRHCGNNPITRVLRELAHNRI